MAWPSPRSWGSRAPNTTGLTTRAARECPRPSSARRGTSAPRCRWQRRKKGCGEASCAPDMGATGYGASGRRTPSLAGPKLSIPGAANLSGASFHEFRLRVGFLHLPVPYIGMIHSAAIQAIARSHEMEPWSIGGNYDRPIQRRLAEEAGVPRELFGQRKRAGAHFRIDEIGMMTATSQADYHAFYVDLRRRAPKLQWLEGPHQARFRQATPQEASLSGTTPPTRFRHRTAADKGLPTGRHAKTVGVPLHHAVGAGTHSTSVSRRRAGAA